MAANEINTLEIPIDSIIENPKITDRIVTINTPPPIPSKPESTPTLTPISAADNILNLILGLVFPVFLFKNMLIAIIIKTIPKNICNILVGAYDARKPPKNPPNIPNIPKIIPGFKIFFFD